MEPRAKEDKMRPEEYLELGILYVREGRFEDGHRALRQAALQYGERNDKAIPPVLLSYYGLCLVALRRDTERGLRYCKRAVHEAGARPDFYLNLGKAYLFLKKKPDAITAFQHGLQIDDDPRLVAALKRLGTRNLPTIPFLPRRNFLNRYLGLWRSRRRRR
jgi:tetratricopeptide (TPR) repeat protein